MEVSGTGVEIYPIQVQCDFVSDHLFIYFMAICISIEKYLFRSFLYFLTGLLFSFFFKVFFFFYIFQESGYESFVRGLVCRYLLPSCPLPLLFSLLCQSFLD